MEYYQIQFGILPEEKQEQLIALLSETGFSGFEETDNGLRAFIEAGIWDEQLFHEVIEVVPVKYSISTVKEENWNAKWEAEFEPVLVLHPETGKPWVRIRAHFHDRDEEVPVELVVTPKMSFGTGHHATTYLVSQAMAVQDIKGKKLIDFGTGTGVLAILAEKLGAADVLAIDYDPWCMENAAENLAANDCGHVRLLQADSLAAIREDADLILANINLNIIRENLDDIARLLKKGGIVIFSGLLETDEALICPEIESRGLQVRAVFHKNGWIGIEAVKS